MALSENRELFPVICEFMTIGEQPCRLILNRADDTTIQRTAMQPGMLSMCESGIHKALLAKTSLGEVMPVTSGPVTKDLKRDSAPVFGSSGRE